MPALRLLLSEAQPTAVHRQRWRPGTGAAVPASPDEVISYLRERDITLTYDHQDGTLQAGTSPAIKIRIRTAG